MKSLPWLKIPLACLLVALAVASLIVPVKAVLTDGTVHDISSLGAGSPDIEISSNGTFIAVTYYKQSNGEGPVYVKSADSAGGWVTATFVGTGSDPQLAFQSGVNNVVYVVWRKAGGTAIASAKCTLVSATAPNCSVGADVRTVSTDQLNFPDVAVTNSGIVHVVWQNSTGPGVTQIETARSTAATNVSAWNAPVTVAGSGVNRKPVLTFGNGLLHLAFLNGSSTSILTQVRYYQSSNGSSWSNPKNFRLGTEIIGGTAHDTLDNPAIAVSSNNVYLAWDAHRNGSSDYSLLQATSTAADGSSWPANASYAPSGTAATSNPTVEVKSSTTLSLPPQQVGLRPSLAISNTTPVIAWQEIPGQVGCAAVTPFFYIFRVSPLTGIADYSTEFLQNQGDDDEMIDVDLAIGSSGVHQVFMRDNNVTSCPPPNGANGYLITYRGPFINRGNDAGEGGNGVFLPIIQKSS